MKLLFIVQCYLQILLITNVAKYLISEGSNKKIKNKDGKTPHDDAYNWIDDNSQKDIIRELLK